MKQENKIVELFEAENGLWGTKDAEGNIFDEPVYERVEDWDGKEYFYDKENGLRCEFSPSGFVTKELFSSSIVDIFKSIDMPEKYNHYIWKLHNEGFNDWGAGDCAAAKAIKTLKLDDVQVRALRDVWFFYYWDMRCCTNDGGQQRLRDDYEWIKENINHISAELRISSLMPVMESERLSDDEKAMIWYGNFRVIQTFDDRFRFEEVIDDDDIEFGDEVDF